MKKELTQKMIKEVLNYCPDTGVFTWNMPRGNHVKKGDTAGGPHSQGYIRVAVFGKRYLAHRLAWFYVYGEWPDKEIDHIDGNKKNNTLSNLRDVTPSENQRNVRRNKNNTSGYNGVCWNKERKRWQSKIHIEGKRTHLGWYKNIERAIWAYNITARALGYHPNHGRP